jgi:hypothetical protein
LIRAGDLRSVQDPRLGTVKTLTHHAKILSGRRRWDLNRR